MKSISIATTIKALFLPCFLLLIGCSNSIKLTEIEKAKDCKTTIEGFYFAADQWSETKPALLIEENGKRRFLKGEIISYDSSGVTFDPKRESPLYDPEPQYYPFEQVVTLIDDEGRLITGSIPEKLTTAFTLELFLIDSSSSNKKPYRMALKPNQRFGFCIPEGNYEIVRMLFVDKKGNIDIGVDLPKLSVLIEADHSNHIGALYLNMAGSTTTDSLIIPYKILSRPNEAAMMGVLGGAIGGALHAASISSQGIIGKHRLYVSRNEGTEEQAKLPVKYNYLTIHKAE